MTNVKRLVSAVIMFALSGIPAYADNAALTAKAQKAVGILYAQGMQGELQMRCTATAFRKVKDTYEFVTAAHCIGDDNKDKERAATGLDIPFYITKDEPGGVKIYRRAEVKWVGFQSRGEDFAVLTVEANDEWEVIELGDEKLETSGALITNVASPIGLGFQIFHGNITSLNLDRPVVDNRGINWRGALLLDISSNGGSSGSALLSQTHETIIGFLVGAIANTVVGIPVSRFKAVRAAVEKKTYRWWVPDTNISPDGSLQE